VGAIDILKKEGNKIPKVFWAIPGDQVPAALKEKTKGIDAYDSIFATQAEVGDFGGVELKEGDYKDCAVLCYSSGTVSSPFPASARAFLNLFILPHRLVSQKVSQCFLSFYSA
jgi:hypothetical protein